MTSVKVNGVASPSTSSPESWLSPVDISHFTSEQQQAVKEVLCEECGAFARNRGDIGCIPSLQMEIRIKDDIPVQRAYASIPKPLYKEVKEYIQELLVKGWIVKSQSPYSAPVICVRKKDGSDRHPLLRIQDLTDSLGGYAWFSILDQGKAYHQGFIAEGSRSFDEHVQVLRRVLQALERDGVKLKPEKCELYRKEIRYVGRLVSAEGVRMDPKDIEAVRALKDKTPQTVGDVRQLLGFLSYYRTYMQDFSRIAKP
ncbi:hypothetical protein DPEC_G00125400 [Dallia pectoralis]|uniref:Uncharacterized protein n=1 Tax=Dallia pectoralis TaxID=75939 RepID=A0ACC2GQZ5_DALPE|nr:hypothetical protein DPEC_G00125400 [Dallia pectoralis]